MELGKKIKQLRLKAKLTQEQLAEQLGIGPQSVSKWENSVAMPDISTLPMLAEIFGVTIDDLFDLTTEQRFNRIEHRMDIEDDLPQDVFLEYEEFLKGQLENEQYRKRATELIAYLYWHRMHSYSVKASRFAKDSVRMSPNEKGCRWILNYTDGHKPWDWNMSNHTAAIEFCREIVKENPESELSWSYLLDNLIADHRADEAEEVLKKMSALKDTKPILNEVYRAHIALARFDEPAADRIMEDLAAAHPDDDACLFETAQYYAAKCDYEKAIGYYERSFEKSRRRPRFRDDLDGIADCWQNLGEYKKAAETYDRIVALLRDEWGYTDEPDIKHALEKKASLLAKLEK